VVAVATRAAQVAVEVYANGAIRRTTILDSGLYVALPTASHQPLHRIQRQFIYQQLHLILPHIMVVQLLMVILYLQAVIQLLMQMLLMKFIQAMVQSNRLQSIKLDCIALDLMLQWILCHIL
jgi:hypothetical protein